MGLFGLNQKEDLEAKRIEKVQLERCLRNLESTKKAADNLDKAARRVQEVLSDYERKEHERQFISVDLVLDLKYLKEQSDVLHNGITNISDVQLAEVKKQIDSQKEVFELLGLGVEQEREAHRRIEKKVRSSNRIIKFLMVTQVLTLATVIVLLLHAAEIIVF